MLHPRTRLLIFSLFLGRSLLSALVLFVSPHPLFGIPKTITIRNAQTFSAFKRHLKTSLSGCVSHYPLTSVSNAPSFSFDFGAIQIVYLLTYLLKLLRAVTLGGAYDESGVFPVGLQGHVICCSGR